MLIVIAFYFFLIRPQKKQEKEVQKMRDGIAVGDKVTTIGGITGEVTLCSIIHDNLFFFKSFHNNLMRFICPSFDNINILAVNLYDFAGNSADCCNLIADRNPTTYFLNLVVPMKVFTGKSVRF